MTEISNRHFQVLIDKLPVVLGMVWKGQPPQTLRQYEAIRQLSILHDQLKKKQDNQQSKTKAL